MPACTPSSSSSKAKLEMSEIMAETDVVRPVTSVIKGHNDALMAEVARLWIKPEDVVVDLTFGKGNFWKTYSPPHLVSYSGDFTNTGWHSSWVDVVVFDPPYTSPGGRATSTIDDFNDAYGLHDTPPTPALLHDLITEGLDECDRILKPGGLLMVKHANYISSGKYQQGHYWILLHAEDMGMEQVDEFILHSGTGPQPKLNPDGSPRRQVHSRRAHSFLSIFRSHS